MPTPYRTVLVNRGRPEEPIFKYADNAVYTTKYSVITFVPKFLFEQFSRYANLFFLAIACIQQIPGITPISRWGTALPLSIIILFTGVKEFAEDWRRRQADNRANQAKGQIFINSSNSFDPCKWENIKVGDLIMVRGGQEFPADLVLLKSSKEDGDCYVETSNIDGETNLKSRQSITVLVDEHDLRNVKGIIKCDEPNNRIYDFEGLFVLGDQEASLGPNQLLLRGSRLMNTTWIIGVAVYTGRETKIVMNSETTRIKRSSIEKMTNSQILILFAVLITIVSGCFLAFFLITKFYSHQLPYLMASYELDTGRLIKKFFTFLVLMNNLVPISLILTMEVIRVRLGVLINVDMDLYCSETDTPASVKTTSLIEELGQVEYIFSDKTGTLTRNEMIMRKICVQGRTISDAAEHVDAKEFPGLEHLLVMMATCNAAVVGEAADGTRTYQSSSPDEIAIVEAAAGLGASLIERRLNAINIKTLYDEFLEPRTEHFKILAVLEFDSTRKRMSVILQDTNDKIWIFCKGADAVILPRLSPENDQKIVQASTQSINEMALVGLRTLVFSYREISRQEYEMWTPIWTRSQTEIQNRREAMDKAIDMIEKDFMLAGVTGVEDRLQDSVPQTIEKLHGASIRIWVLTGDKLETAVNIGYSCSLLEPKTTLLQLSSPVAITAALNDFADQMSNLKGPQNAAIVLEAAATQEILQQEELQDLFVKVAKRCRTVICCRVSPSQKAKVVQLVQKREKAVCLAIGDGANDVGMIQAAQIGVGISGREGLQAARSADFSIAQFQFLQKLLLVHGAWGYHRISKAAVFCVYKNILLYACQLWFAFATLFSGQTIFESWMIGLYNVLFTAWPPIVLGLTDQFVTAPFLMSHPKLYRFGQENTFYNTKTFWQSAINGFLQSFLAFVVTAAVMLKGAPLHDGREVTLFFMGTTVFAGVMLTVMLKAALLINYWTFLAVLGLLACPISWVAYVLLYDNVSAILGSPPGFSDLVGLSRPLFSSVTFWMTAFLIPILCLLRDFIWKFYQRQFIPQEYHIVQELQKEEKKVMRVNSKLRRSNTHH
jgi:phospholipid-transporting ATPase